jgi:hypothetical protein
MSALTGPSTAGVREAIPRGGFELLFKFVLAFVPRGRLDSDNGARLAPPRHRLAHRDLLRFLDLRIWRMLFGNLQQR